MKKFLRLLGVMAIGLGAVGVVGIIFAYSGLYNVAATTGHTKPIEQILRVTMMRSVVAHARGIVPPADFKPMDHELAEHAAGHYDAMCRTCHGAPGRKPDPWQLYPPAPDLADALRVTRWSDAEVFWIIKNGLKDTGMSAFGQSHDDEEIWALTAFVRQLDTLSPDQFRTMTQQAATKDAHGHQEHGDDKPGPPESTAKSAPPHQH